MRTTIEIFADIWCPFAHVGLREARRERERTHRDDVDFLVRPWPLELVNATALDPSVTARHVRELKDQVAPDLFAGFDETTFPATTLPALSLVVAAYEHDVLTGEALSWALRDALFESGVDVSDPAVLDEFATLFGLDKGAVSHVELVEAQWHEGQRRGVRGSPHFFCSGREAFCPALDIARSDLGDLAVRVNSQRLTTFLEECLTGAAP